MQFVIKTKNSKYLTTRFGYSKDINKARVYEHGLYWNLSPNEKMVNVKKYVVIEEVANGSI